MTQNIHMTLARCPSRKAQPDQFTVWADMLDGTSYVWGAEHRSSQGAVDAAKNIAHVAKGHLQLVTTYDDRGNALFRIDMNGKEFNLDESRSRQRQYSRPVCVVIRTST